MADSFPGSATDPFAVYDAAYVLGALSPEDRHAFEAHLRTCQSCAFAVQELAGIPGLLARADILADDAPTDPPDALLPRLLASLSRERRRHRLLAGSGWLAATACAIALTLLLVLGGGSAPTAVPGQPMKQLAGTDLAGQVSLTGVTWGTRIELKCTYPDGPAEDWSYKLVVVDKDNTPQEVGTWKFVPGRTATMNASSSIAAEDIKRVEVRTAAGVALLEFERP